MGNLLDFRKTEKNEKKLVKTEGQLQEIGRHLCTDTRRKKGEEEPY